MRKSDSKNEEKDECIVHSHPVPAEDLWRYSPERDPHCELDIAGYVEGQAHDETVQNVEKIKQEIVLGDVYEIWDIIFTDSMG